MAVDNQSIGTALFRALCCDDSKDEKIQDLCSKTSEGPLLYCTIHNSTVLHLACSFKRFGLASQLLDGLDDAHINLIPKKTNNWGDTILQNASTSNKGVDFVNKLLQKAPQVLQVRNDSEESCVFKAIRYGKRKMFRYLVEEVDKVCDLNENDHLYYFRNKDNTTILHMAILTRQFDVALTIAKRYPKLCGLQDKNQMTALQMLACSPTAFKSGVELGCLKRFIYSFVSPDEQDTNEGNGIIQRTNKLIRRACCQGKSSYMIIPLIDEIIKLKKSNQDAVKLAEILIESDTSWRFDTYKPLREVTPVIIGITDEGKAGHEDVHVKIDEGKAGHEDVHGITGVTPVITYHEIDIITDVTPAIAKDGVEREGTSKTHGYLVSNEAPLLLAARKGCIEIVEAILDKFPQAVDYLNNDRENLVHVAVKSRNLDILKLFDKKPHFSNFLRAVDNKNNSVLHMAAYPTTEASLHSKTKSPVLELSDELLLMESLKEKCPKYLANHRNAEMLTADELLAKEREPLRADAKEWLKRTSKHCTVVIVLIATVAFAAAYTVPGGPNETTGLPVLGKHPLFIVFTVTDVLSLGFALTAVVVFLTILTSPYRLKDFRRSLPQKLWLGFTLLFLSVSMMMVAFAATIILMIHSKEKWTKIALYIVAFFPIFIFMLSYIPIYAQLFEAFTYWITKIAKFIPRPITKPTYPTTFKTV